VRSVVGGLPAVVHVTVTPSAPSLVVGGTLGLTVSLTDSQNRPVFGKTVSWASDATSIAMVDQLGVVTGVKAGSALITATADGVSGAASVSVTAPTGSGASIVVDPAVTYQTMVAWEGDSQMGEIECDRNAFALYQPVVLDRVVNELGINGVALGLRSGWENPVDEFPGILAGTIPIQRLHDAAYYAINDNADPFVADPKGFQWSMLDYKIETNLVPLRARLAARGEKLYVRAIVGDWLRSNTPQPFRLMAQPEEYAEFVTEAFRHIRAKFGFSPDALDLTNEPEHTGYSGTQMGQALVAAGKRLAAAGFHPDLIGPATTSMANASTFYDAIVAVPGAKQYLTDLSYHRYEGVSAATLQAIALRQQRDHIRTGMLEHIGSGIEDLWDDLTVANNSSWMQGVLAFCSQQDNPSSGGTYYQINQTDPANPKVNFTTRARVLRQVFLYVRAGAVRVGASSSAAGSVDAMAFRNANGGYVAVVYARSGGASFTVRGLPAGTYGLTYATAAQYGVPLADVTVAAGGTLSSAIPAAGVLTIFAR
jgi:hypothetical protein